MEINISEIEVYPAHLLNAVNSAIPDLRNANV
jgi:hypothetical protein